MDLQSYLPIIVVLGVAGFLLGNFFAIKPKAHEVRTADFRLLARKFGLNPKLIARPTWLPAKAQSQTHHAPKSDLIASYAVVCDDWRLPWVRFVAKDGVWQKVAIDDELLDRQAKKGDILDMATIGLPKDMAGNAIALQVKANSITFYWQDNRYQSSQGVQKLDTKQAEQDLTALQTTLSQWATMICQK